MPGRVAPRYTIADLERLPDDGNRYELLGGVLRVTPASGPPHQVALGRLTMAVSAYLGSDGPAVVTSLGVVWRVDLCDRVLYVSRPGGPADVPHAGRVVWHPPEIAEPLDLNLQTVFGAIAPSR